MERYVIKFEKGPGVKFISHLDLMRCFQRAIRRANIPITYSMGFNPHGEFSFATPLPVGTWSRGEYMEISMDDKVEEGIIMDRLGKTLPADIKLVSVKAAGDKIRSLMSMVDASSYEITLVNVGGSDALAAVDAFLNMERIEIVKESKKGERALDIKPMIRDMKVLYHAEGEITLYALVDSGSRSNLSPELIVNALKKYVNNFQNAEIRDIIKLDTYVEDGGTLKTPLELL